MAKRTCVVCGVTFEQTGKGRPSIVCAEHRDAYYLEDSRRRAREWQKKNYVPKPRTPAPEVCTVDGCAKKNEGGGMCSMHRRRLERLGTFDLPEVRCSMCGGPTGKFGLNIPVLHCKACQPKAKADAHRAWIANNPERRAVHQRRSVLARYGLTAETWDELFASQGRACAICRAPYVAPVQHWHVDHCHDTGRIRGILCRRCNQSIGDFGDDPDLLRAAADYLDQKPAGAAKPVS